VGNVLWVVMGSIVIVLLVVCANVVNLMLVRVEGRRQELAVRSAFGANRKKIIVGLLLESLVIACVGSVIGLALAFGALRLLTAAAPIGLPCLQEIGIDLPVLLFTAGLALFVSLAISMIPMLKYSGITAGTGLREGGGKPLVFVSRMSSRRQISWQAVKPSALQSLLPLGKGRSKCSTMRLREVRNGESTKSTDRFRRALCVAPEKILERSIHCVLARRILC
jgi:hypothetical protein